MQAFQPLPWSAARFTAMVCCSIHRLQPSFIKPLDLLCSAAVVLAALLIARALLCLVHILASQVPVSCCHPDGMTSVARLPQALHAVKRLLTFFVYDCTAAREGRCECSAAVRRHAEQVVLSDDRWLYAETTQPICATCKCVVAFSRARLVFL